MSVLLWLWRMIENCLAVTPLRASKFHIHPTSYFFLLYLPRTIVPIRPSLLGGAFRLRVATPKTRKLFFHSCSRRGLFLGSTIVSSQFEKTLFGSVASSSPRNVRLHALPNPHPGPRRATLRPPRARLEAPIHPTRKRRRGAREESVDTRGDQGRRRGV